MNNEIIIGDTKTKFYEPEVDNFSNIPQIINFLFLPLNDDKGEILGVAQFYNCKFDTINDCVIVIITKRQNSIKSIKQLIEALVMNIKEITKAINVSINANKVTKDLRNILKM